MLVYSYKITTAVVVPRSTISVEEVASEVKLVTSRSLLLRVNQTLRRQQRTGIGFIQEPVLQQDYAITRKRGNQSPERLAAKA